MERESDAAVDGGSDAAVDGGSDAAAPSGGPSWMDAGSDDAVDAGGDAAVPIAIPDAGFKCYDLPPLPSAGEVRLVPVFTDTLDAQDVNRAVQLEQSPLDARRWYLVRQTGELLTFREGDSEPHVALDLTEDVWTDHPEAGMVSLAFAPNFEDSGWLYVVYSTPGGDLQFLSRVSRFRADDAEGLSFDRNSEEVILDVPQPHGSHSVNHVRFGPDGLLYISLGDGKNPYDSSRNGQNTDTLYGAILRIDPSQPNEESGTAYRIPEDNPFAEGGGAPEIFAWGMRNPWRFSFDSETGEMWAGDVGQDSREEINRVALGGNYGWSDKEGSMCFNEPLCEELEGLIDPYHEYTHNQGGVTRGGSATGGYVYHGELNPSLAGRYVFGDYKTGRLWALDVQDAPGPAATLLLESEHGIASFFEAWDGELYVVGYSKEGAGGLYRIEPGGNVSTEEVWLSDTGCVRSADPRRPIESALPYDVTAALWSDGAEKTRALVLPPGAVIETFDDGDFALPVGAVLIKTFGYDDDIHETRLLVHHEPGWAGYSFEWNEERTDARLLPSSKHVRLASDHAWTYPSRSDCKQCHTAAAGVVLGLEWIQQGALDGVVQAMVDRGFFGSRVNRVEDLSVSRLDTLRDPLGDASLDLRARSYLHANCSGCHRPNVDGQQALIDLRFAQPLGDTKTCGLQPEQGDLYGAVEDAQILYPGNANQSVLYRRMTSLERFRMPALGSAVVDERGSQLIGEWIDAMGGCPGMP